MLGRGSQAGNEAPNGVSSREAGNPAALSDQRPTVGARDDYVTLADQLFLAPDEFRWNEYNITHIEFALNIFCPHNTYTSG